MVTLAFFMREGKLLLMKKWFLWTNALSSTNVGIGISTDHAFPLSDGSVRNANGFSLTTSQMRIRYHASNELSQSAEDQIAVHVVVWTFGAGNY